MADQNEQLVKARATKTKPCSSRSPCANSAVLAGIEAGNCSQKAHLTCNHCHLVQYCSRACQRLHWQQHKQDCKRSDLGATNWQPHWAVEGRQPAFAGDGPPGPVPFGACKYLWGNVPAFDLLNLKDNEGNAYQQDLKVCCAGSGDLRNILLTVLGLPNGYVGKCTCILNDRDHDIVLRNLVMLLSAFALAADEAPIVMLHLWYSAKLPSWVLDTVLSKVVPFIADVCEKIRGKASTSLQSKKWHFGQAELRVVLTNSQWQRTLKVLNAQIDVEAAESSRQAIVLAPSRRDYVDRNLFCMKPFARVAAMHYRKTGILAPFGAQLSDFDRANPTLYSLQAEWLQKDSADPLEGWKVQDVLNSGREAGFPANDQYGALACHVNKILRGFCQQVTKVNLSIQLYHFDAQELPQYLDNDDFDRVEVSNMTDRGWLGMETVLETFGPLLQRKSENAHATIITLFLNAVPETEVRQPTRDVNELKSAMLKVQQYIQIPRQPPLSDYDPEFLRIVMTKDLFLDFDDIFNRYMATVSFQNIARRTAMYIKAKNSIIDKWPHRLKMEPGTEAAQREFDILHRSGLTGCERLSNVADLVPEKNCSGSSSMAEGIGVQAKGKAIVTEEEAERIRRQPKSKTHIEMQLVNPVLQTEHC